MTDDTKGLADKDGAKTEKAAAKAAKQATSARVKYQEALDKWNETHNPDGSEKSDQQVELERLKREADEADAALAEAGAGPVEHAETMAEAKTLAVPEDEEVAADSGHWRAQKFGNDPANPQPATGEHSDPEKKTVELTRKTPDLPEGKLQRTWVHPDMVGDYMRAGWSRAA